MKNFKITDCFIQAILLLLSISWAFSYKGEAWWGPLTQAIVLSSFTSHLPVLIISAWQFVSAVAHSRFPQYNIKKARLVYFILLLLLIVQMTKAVRGIGFTPIDAYSAILRLSSLNFLLALCYFVLCVVETRAIKKKQLA